VHHPKICGVSLVHRFRPNRRSLAGFNEVDGVWSHQSFSHAQIVGTVESAAFLFDVPERRDPAVELSRKKWLAVVLEQVGWLRLE
jgi:hypothetical protein